MYLSIDKPGGGGGGTGGGNIWLKPTVGAKNTLKIAIIFILFLFMSLFIRHIRKKKSHGFKKKKKNINLDIFLKQFYVLGGFYCSFL